MGFESHQSLLLLLLLQLISFLRLWPHFHMLSMVTFKLH